MSDPGDRQLRQRLYRSDGRFRDRLADSWEFHPAHAHFHYKNFMLSQLWRSNVRGQRVGGAPIRTRRKNGFCMIDVDNIAFGEKGDAAKTYGFPRCNAPTDVERGGAYMTNGVSPGWADVYPWFLAGQYIEVSGLEDRYYLLESIADPANTILESNDADNTSAVLVRLSADRAQVIRNVRVRPRARQDGTARRRGAAGRLLRDRRS